MTQLFFLYIETADRLTPLVGVATLHNQLPSPLEKGSFFFLDKNEHSVLYSFFFFLIFIKKERKRKRKRKRKERGKRRIKRLFGAKTLRAEFPTQNLYLFLYAFSFLQINVKQFFRVIFFTLGLLWATFLREGGNIFARFSFFFLFFFLVFFFLILFLELSLI